MQFPLAFSLILCSLIRLAISQQSSSSITSPSTTSFTTSVPRTTTFATNGRLVTSTAFVSTTIVSTLAPSPAVNASATAVNSSASPSNSTAAAPSASSTGPPPIHLDTRLDPAFGVLGAILILTGLPCAFLGHKNRWSSYFLTGFYSFSVICLALIIKFGVLPAINPPSTTLKGLFLLSSAVAGSAGGAISILFWGQAKYFVGALGGFVFALWVQCFHDGGVIKPIGFRWILYIGCGVLGFVLCTIPKLHYHVLLVATAIIGASAFMLGVDCYTLANLKEFYMYNLGFGPLFPKFADKPFPVSQVMQIELGLIAATALAGMAIQFRILVVLQVKLKQIKAEQKRSNDAIEASAVERFVDVEKDLSLWEKEHGRSSVQPLLKSPTDDPQVVGELSSEADTLIGKRGRHQSMLSDFVAPGLTAGADDPKDPRQSIGPLPMMNLGRNIENNLSDNLDQPNEGTSGKGKDSASKGKERDSWLLDFEDVRKSFDWLRVGTPADSVKEDGRKAPSISRPRTLSQELSTAFPVASERSSVIMDTASRIRVQSADALPSDQQPILKPNWDTNGRLIGRTTSTPLRDDDWDAYVHERKLFTPPSGVSDPIPASQLPERPRSASFLLTVPESVKAAITDRKARETAVLPPNAENLGKDDIKHVEINMPRHERSRSLGHMPIEVLPPRDAHSPGSRPEISRTVTFEELAERHRRKMHQLQNPLSEATKEEAALEAARRRWEKSRQTDKEVSQRHQIERSSRIRDTAILTPAQIATTPIGGGRRSSTAKVLEWQRLQQRDADHQRARATSPPPGQNRPRSVQPEIALSKSDNKVPFPGRVRPPREK